MAVWRNEDGGVGRGAKQGRTERGWSEVWSLTTPLLATGCYSPPSGGGSGNTFIDCPAGEECTGTVAANGSSITVFAQSGSATTMKIGVNNSTPLDCPDYAEINPNQYLIDVPAQDRPKSVVDHHRQGDHRRHPRLRALAGGAVLRRTGPVRDRWRWHLAVQPGEQ